MTDGDGTYIDVRGSGYFNVPYSPAEVEHVAPQEPDPPILDLSTFDSWIELQPVEASVDLLYRIAHDLATNKGWPGIGYEVRCAADTLKTLTRHG